MVGFRGLGFHFAVGKSGGKAKQIVEIASIAKHNFFTLPFSFELELWRFIFADDYIRRTFGGWDAVDFVQ